MYISSAYIHYLLVDSSNASFCIYWLSYLPQEYLQHFYGYRPKSERQKRSADTDVDADWTTGLCDKVRNMQRFFGLPPSGELTQETLAVMKRPRCGLSDVERFGETIRWKRKTLSYRLEMIRKQCSQIMWFLLKRKHITSGWNTGSNNDNGFAFTVGYIALCCILPIHTHS